MLCAAITTHIFRDLHLAKPKTSYAGTNLHLLLPTALASTLLLSVSEFWLFKKACIRELGSNCPSVFGIFHLA